MKRRLPPGIVIVALTLALSTLAKPSLRAGEILWQATSSSAWITGANWAGGVMPGSGDIAQFGSLGPSSVALALHHPSYEPKGSAYVGAITVLASRSKGLDLAGNANSASALYLMGATMNGRADTVLVNESAWDLTLKPDSGNSRQMSLALRANQDHLVQVRGAGNIIITAPVTGSGATLSVAASGSGAVVLSATNSTYSGGTILLEGRLEITAAQAAGTGDLLVRGGSAKIAAGVSFSKAVKIEAEGASYKREYGDGGGYQGFSVESHLGGRDLQVHLLGGSAVGERTLSAGFRLEADAVNDALRQSDLLEWNGTGDDVYVLELKTGSEAWSGGYLGWLDGDQWVNATAGNSTPGALAITGFEGSFQLSGAAATADYLGSWGYDPASHSVWAILDHDGMFAVIPEPGGGRILLFGFGLLGLHPLIRRRKLFFH